jgi:hypothetical protein
MTAIFIFTSHAVLVNDCRSSKPTNIAQVRSRIAVRNRANYAPLSANEEFLHAEWVSYLERQQLHPAHEIHWMVIRATKRGGLFLDRIARISLLLVRFGEQL